MKFEPKLKCASLVRRYKRFLTDVRLPSGEDVTIHCPNTGSMKGCLFPGGKVWFSESSNLKRKYPYTWEIAESDSGDFILINTALPNKLVREAIEAGVLSELLGYEKIQPEVRYGDEKSRIDLFLSEGSRPDCYVEVKNVTLLESDAQGYFPDAVSLRGQKHLRELERVAVSGLRAVLVFCVSHTGIKSVSPAEHIDPAYARTLREVVANGVEVLAYECEVSPERVRVSRQLPVKL